jgi:hypothetical protein
MNGRADASLRGEVRLLQDYPNHNLLGNFKHDHTIYCACMESHVLRNAKNIVASAKVQPKNTVSAAKI